MFDFAHIPFSRFGRFLTISQMDGQVWLRLVKGGDLRPSLGRLCRIVGPADWTLAPDVLTLTFNGLSKAYRVAGYRSGWLVITGPKEHASSFIEGISLLANMRLCPNVPAQHAIQVALGGHQSIEELVLPGGRLLEQRDVAWAKLNEIPGVSCVKPQGALYAFPRLDPEVYDIPDDEQLVLDLLLQEKILVTQGTGFNWPAPDHLRIVTLPWARDLSNAIERLGNFLVSYRG